MNHSAVTGRVRSLDALRGLAICGIMLVNTWQHTLAYRKATSVDWVMGNLFQSRFYPIFAFLFGMGFALFLQSAGSRTPRPRLVLLRRLAVLALLGAVHTRIEPGEVLLPYAILGVTVLLPASFLPRPLVLLAGTGTMVAAMVTGRPYVLIAALFLLGLATVGYGAAGRLASPVVFGTSAVLAVLLTWWWNHSPPGGGVYQAAALCGAAAYGTGFLLAVRRTALFEALGRMALTNYVSSTAAILAAAPLLRVDDTGSAVIAVTVVTLVAQAAFSRWWLTRYRYGPLEWIWRCLTWWEPVANRQTGTRDPHSPVPDPRRPRSEDEPRDRS
ncbi:hypothetical protein GCM10023194_23770 [Planotetraspora phitsanulokensis]|uniref:DUF418 domain-containing protein n=1 Tax=Planotetraspora phitsanulokensis TaxID=575192 RepID=A0A8J3XF16_9ACTN|nr:DUF418 domain-containing protein [Planotetraspora phitsanulokensis]GII38434.1 hypothetical protein Pph01_34370 [Planotetraspora phitsanulokensis]